MIGKFRMIQNKYCIKSDGLLNTRIIYTHVTLNHENPGVHYHDFIEFFYVLDGQCTHVQDGISTTITIGDACLLTPNNVHCFENASNTFLHRDILFQTDYFKSICDVYAHDLYDKFANGTLCTQLNMTSEQLNQLEHLIQPIALNPDIQDSLYAGAVCTFVITTFLSQHLNMQTQCPIWITKLLSLLSAPENFTIDQQSLIRTFPYSQEYICRTFKKITGKTITDYFNEQKMKYAYTLLQTSSYSIEQICERINFNNVSYFYRLYKKIFNKTPRKN